MELTLEQKLETYIHNIKDRMEMYKDCKDAFMEIEEYEKAQTFNIKVIEYGHIIIELELLLI